MFRVRVTALTAAAAVSIFALTAPAAMAQSTDTAASTPKQVQKAQRKASRNAARTKKNAELNTLEKNGYQPAGEQKNYPQNIQNAEKKTGAANAASGQ